VGSQTTPGLPTLADQLAQSPRGDTPTDGPLTVLFEGAGATPDALAALPAGTVHVTVTENGLHDLLRVVRSSSGDVLLVSDSDLLTRPALAGLRRALADDSACTTVSVDERSRPTAPGLPPPGIDSPRAGVVLVRRDDLVLASDEGDLTGRFVGGSRANTDAGPIVAGLLALLDRPGFVHRAYGLEGEVAPIGQRFDHSPARRAAADVLIDGTCLAHPLTGTQVQVLALVGGLARAGADVRVMRPHELHPTVALEVAALAREVEFVERRAVGKPSVLHRPFQLVSLHDLADRLVIPERMVLTHQDMIWARTRAYHDVDAWVDYRQAATTALAAADEVGFFSMHAAVDAASEGCLELDRATVIPLGVDHLVTGDGHDDSPPPLGGRPYLLMVGTSFWHKNRVFSLRVLRWLVERGGWDGGLVFAGGHHPRTSSLPAEELFLARNPSLRSRVVDRGHVPAPERLALYRDAELVLFPSLYEGFGLVPFEAAALGTACVYTRRSAMGELLPPAGALPSFELEEAGRFLLDLLESSPGRSRIVEEISAVAAGLTWDRAAAAYIGVYERALERPRRDLGSLLRASLELTGAHGLTAREAAMLDVYRRRRVVRVTVDSTVRAGMSVLGGLRRLRGTRRERQRR
jgi:glycosyltransferase involved in cell wall biosynthesis